MFIQNKYTNLYYNIINRALTRQINGYVEKHHIIPKSLGGSNDIANIVPLTAREHFICHLLLIKMVDKQNKYKMVFAAWQQSRPSKNKDIKVTSHVYEMLRKQMSITYTGRKRAPFSNEAKANMKAGAKNRKQVIYSPERLAKLAANKGNVAGWNKGKKMDLSDEQRAVISNKFSLVNKGKPKNRIVCPHCSKEVAVNTYPRWHGNNCKLNLQVP